MLILFLSSCDDYTGPVQVLNFGLHPDSSTGAMIVGVHDDVYSIARRYRLPIRGIIDLNHLEPPYRLAEGQRLKLPAPVDYRVRAGDTLPMVASMFGVSASQLVAVNNISAPYRLRPGQDLRIPEKYPEQQPVTASSFPRKRESTAFAMQRDSRLRGNDVSMAKAPEKIVSENLQPSIPSQSLAPPSSFLWPVRGKVISGYGAKDDGLYNDGINIAAPRGTPVAAAADGVIAYVGNDLKSYGNLVLIRHGGGTMTAYAHLASMNARRGMRVRRGQIIGTVGATGAVSAAQLHFEIRQGSKPCDPRAYLG